MTWFQMYQVIHIYLYRLCILPDGILLTKSNIVLPQNIYDAYYISIYINAMYRIYNLIVFKLLCKPLPLKHSAVIHWCISTLYFIRSVLMPAPAISSYNIYCEFISPPISYYSHHTKTDPLHYTPLSLLYRYIYRLL